MDSVPAIMAEMEATAERRATPCGDGRLSWRLWGAGPPLVLLHGDFGSWTHWLRNIPALARHFRLLVPDMPGYGASDVPPAPWSPFSLGELLAGGAAAILGGAARYDVAGFSFGGIIGGHLAAVARQSVPKLVLLGAGGLDLRAPDLKPLRRAAAEMDAAERAATHRHNLAACMIEDPAKIDDLAVAIQEANVRRTRLRTGPIPGSDALVRVLPRVRARLFGIWGEHDAYARSDLALRAAVLRASHPELHFRVVPGAGHWTPYEAPETVNAALLEMLG